MNQEALRALATTVIPIVTGAASVFIGFYLIFSALRMLVSAADSRGGQDKDGIWGRIFARLVIGAMLLQFRATMGDVSTLVLGTGIEDYRGAMAYMPASINNSGPWRAVMETVMLWVTFLGWLAALRGFLKWNSASNGGGQSGDLFWQGLWHIVGGAAAINVPVVMRAFSG